MSTADIAQAIVTAAEEETGFQLVSVSLGTNFDDGYVPTDAEAQELATELAASMRRVKEEMDSGTLEVIDPRD